MSFTMKRKFEACVLETRLPVNEEIGRFLAAILDPLSSPEAEGGSRHSLRSVSVQLKWSTFACELQAYDGLVQLLSRFPRLERLELPYLLDNVASAIPAALPALRCAVLRFGDCATLAGLALHSALEELDVSATELHEGDDRGPASGFDVFAAGPAAARLRKLTINFCGGFDPEFDIADLPSLRHLTSLEALELNVDMDFYAFDDDDDDENSEGQSQEEGEGTAKALGPAKPLSRLDEYLAGMQRLRKLDLNIHFQSKDVNHIRAIARPLPALCGRNLVEFNCRLGVGNPFMNLDDESKPEVDSALAELLRAAGPSLVVLAGGIARGEAFSALAACPRLRELRLVDKLGYPDRLDSRWRPEPPDWLARGDHETLAGLHRLRILDLNLFYAGRLGPAHLRCLARSATELCVHSLAELHLKIYSSTSYIVHRNYIATRLDPLPLTLNLALARRGRAVTEDEAGVDAALAELLRAAAPAFVELGVGAAVLKGDAARALAACGRLARLELVEPGVPDTLWEPVPIAEAVDAVIACPSLKVISGLIVPFMVSSVERGASKLLEPLRRLAAARAFDSPSCFFVLRPGGRLGGERLEKAVEIVMELVLAAFPRAVVETPSGTYHHPFFWPRSQY
eukprot:tig00001497_g9210.t1